MYGEKASIEKPQPLPQWHFFVSYTAVDRMWAEWVAWQLEDAGYRVLFQEWDFVAGSHWTSGIRDGIERAERTLAILSPAYLDSVYGQAEWESAYYADPRGFARKLLPVRVEECDRPGLLGRVVSFDVFGRSADTARKDLLDRIGHAVVGRAKPAAEPAFPPQPAQSHPVAGGEPDFPGARSWSARRRRRTTVMVGAGSAVAAALASLVFLETAWPGASLPTWKGDPHVVDQPVTPLADVTATSSGVRPPSAAVEPSPSAATGRPAGGGRPLGLVEDHEPETAPASPPRSPPTAEPAEQADPTDPADLSVIRDERPGCVHGHHRWTVSQGKVTCTPDAPGAVFHDISDGHTSVAFDRPDDAASGRYSVELTFTDPSRHTCLAVWFQGVYNMETCSNVAAIKTAGGDIAREGYRPSTVVRLTASVNGTELTLDVKGDENPDPVRLTANRPFTSYDTFGLAFYAQDPGTNVTVSNFVYTYLP